MTYSNIGYSYCSIAVDNELTELIPKKLDYTGEMNGGILTLQIHQLYRNDKKSTKSSNTDAVLVLPKAKTQCITDINCILNGRSIELKIEEEKRAEEIAKEGEEQGRTTIRSDSSSENFWKIHIGSISYESTIEITIRMEIISANKNSKTYQTIIPFSSQTLRYDFTFSVKFHEIEKISDIDIKCENEKDDFSYSFEDNILSIYEKPISSITIFTELESDIQNCIQNDINDEYSIISIIPKISSKTINSDFIFIVDCSGSMSGNSIRNASECLLVFLHSIPVGCKFDIILFGSNFCSIFDSKELVDYNEQNVNIADKAIRNLSASMGSTNLFGPLKHAYKEVEISSKNGRIAQIFVLTDGGIDNKEIVFQLVNVNCSKSKIFSIGIGHDADKDLVVNLAKLSFGNFDFVSDPSEITNKVVNLLSSSLLPALTNVSVHASGSDDNLLSIAQNPIPPILEGNLMNIYIKRSSKTNPIEGVLINGNVGDEEFEIIIDKIYNCCESSAKKLFAFTAINDYEKIYDDLQSKSSDEKDKTVLDKYKEQIIALSIENGIPSKFTSFVGVGNDSQHDLIPEKLDDYLSGSLVDYQHAQLQQTSNSSYFMSSRFSPYSSRVGRCGYSSSSYRPISRQGSCGYSSISRQGSCGYTESAYRPNEKQETIQDLLIQKSLIGLIRAQDFDGKWNFSYFENLALFFNDDKNEGLKLLNDFFMKQNIENDGDDIKCTVTALIILNKFFLNDKSKWKLIEKKAINWLDSQSQKKWEILIDNYLSKDN